MFTHFSREMGIWKDGHPARARLHDKRTLGKLTWAMGGAAFCTWLLFVLLLKVRADFFFLNSFPMAVQKANPHEHGLVLVPGAGILQIQWVSKTSHTAWLLLEDGEVWEWPKQKKELGKRLLARQERLAQFELLMRQRFPQAGQAFLWAPDAAPIDDIEEFRRFLASVGYAVLAQAVAGVAAESGGEPSDGHSKTHP